MKEFMGKIEMGRPEARVRGIRAEGRTVRKLNRKSNISWGSEVEEAREEKRKIKVES